MKRLLFILLFCVTNIASADITGIAHVTDGDTVKINNTRIRLHGIDAPERNQKCEKYGQKWRCGQASTKLLRTLTTNKTITCKGSSTDRYKRLIAVCYVNGVTLMRRWLMPDWHWPIASIQPSTFPTKKEPNKRKGGCGPVSLLTPGTGAKENG